MKMYSDLFGSDWNFVSFLAGIGAAWGWQQIKCWYLSKKTGKLIRPPGFNPLVIAISVALVGFLYISTQSSQNAGAVRELALKTQECQKQFNEALQIRGQITQDNDKWSMVQRDAMATWIHDLIFPPPPYNTMELDDPRRQAWDLLRTRDADRIVSQAQEEQRLNEIERNKPENQYPEPTCGLE